MCDYNSMQHRVGVPNLGEIWVHFEVIFLSSSVHKTEYNITICLRCQPESMGNKYHRKPSEPVLVVGK